MNDEQNDSIARRLDLIEERLSRIEAADQTDDQPTQIITKRVIALIVFLTVFAGGIYFALNWVFSNLMDVLPD